MVKEATMPVTPKQIMSYRESGRKITMLTAYDYSMARMIDSAGIDIILVGDSLGMVVLGYDSTVPVTMEEMLHHCRAVSRGTENALLVGDMPFMSYQVSKKEALRNAGRFIKEAGCHAVKLEGGREMASTITKIVNAGIPVMGHIGLTPQTATALGGYKVQGRDIDSARKLLKDAEALDHSGAFALVLECVPDTVAKIITERISIPTIGIGAGPWCDGQVLVTHDLLGMFDKFCPSFVKQYAGLSKEIKGALGAFIDEVGQGTFPDAEHSFPGDEKIAAKLAKK